MNAAEQVQRAGQLRAALLFAGVEVVAHHQEAGHGSYRAAEMVDVVGWLARGGYYLRDVTDVGPTQTGPTQTGPAPWPRPRLVKP